MDQGRRISATAALAMGSVSAAALMANTTAANADGLYMGLQYGAATGNIPIQGPGAGDNYQLSGGVFGLFVGYDKTVPNSNLFVGGELAYSGKTKAGLDQGTGSSYDYGYNVNYTIDAKLRVGTNLGKVKVYGFAGMSTGNQYTGDYRGYNFSGMNYGVGADYDVAQNFSVGLELIQRAYNGYGNSSPVIAHPNSTTVSVRGAFHF